MASETTSRKTLIRPERSGDIKAIHRVNVSAFETADEAHLVDALRDGGFVAVSLIAELDGDIVGHILFSRLSIDTTSGTVDALALAPMAVIPPWQRNGIGSRLVEAGLNTAREQGHCMVIVLGHPEFYLRFGFSADLARPLNSPFSGEAWMALELVPGALAGVEGTVRYAEPFGIA